MNHQPTYHGRDQRAFKQATRALREIQRRAAKIAKNSSPSSYRYNLMDRKQRQQPSQNPIAEEGLQEGDPGINAYLELEQGLRHRQFPANTLIPSSNWSKIRQEGSPFDEGVIAASQLVLKKSRYIARVYQNLIEWEKNFRFNLCLEKRAELDTKKFLQNFFENF